MFLTYNGNLYLTSDQIQIGLHEQRQSGERLGAVLIKLGAVLIKLGFISYEILADALADHSRTDAELDDIIDQLQGLAATVTSDTAAWQHPVIRLVNSILIVAEGTAR